MFHCCPILAVTELVFTLVDESTGPYWSSNPCWWPHMPLARSWSSILQSGSGPTAGLGKVRSGCLFVLSGWYLQGAGRAYVVRLARQEEGCVRAAHFEKVA